MKVFTVGDRVRVGPPESLPLAEGMAGKTGAVIEKYGDNYTIRLDDSKIVMLNARRLELVQAASAIEVSFKVGDHVRFKHVSTLTSNGYEGDTGIVEGVRDNGDLKIIGKCGWWFQDRFELVYRPPEPAPQAPNPALGGNAIGKAGDRVRVREYPEIVGVIEAVDLSQEYQYTIRGTEGRVTGCTDRYKGHMLEPLPATPSTPRPASGVKIVTGDGSDPSSLLVGAYTLRCGICNAENATSSLYPHLTDEPVRAMTEAVALCQPCYLQVASFIAHLKDGSARQPRPERKPLETSSWCPEDPDDLLG